MPNKPDRPCSAPRCLALVTGRSRFCPVHDCERWRAEKRDARVRLTSEVKFYK